MSDDRLTGEQFAGLAPDDWVPVLHAAQARWRLPDYPAGLEFVARVGAVAQAADHHPDLDLRHGQVAVRLFSHDVRALTDRDVRLATEISRIAADLGLLPDRERITTIEVALDTWASERARPFWAAVLGGTDDAPRDEVRDDAGAVPTLWFQATEEHEPPRQRFHLDVWAAPEVAPGRIAAALAAGGALVSDAEAPQVTVLADPDGNRVCVCTYLGRA